MRLAVLLLIVCCAGALFRPHDRPSARRACVGSITQNGEAGPDRPAQGIQTYLSTCTLRLTARSDLDTRHTIHEQSAKLIISLLPGFAPPCHFWDEGQLLTARVQLSDW